jgi:Arc/MetJ family transcription regulator
MGRTNIEIDDELIERVMRRYRLPSKRAAVELALRRLAGEPMSRDEALAMEGAGWSGDLEVLRAPDAPGQPGPPGPGTPGPGAPRPGGPGRASGS